MEALILLFAFSLLLFYEAGRACSRLRQWKHVRERARLATKTVKAVSRLQNFS